MEHLSVEELIALASVFSIELSKNKDKKTLIKYKTFFSSVSNNLQAIINEKK